MPLHAFSESVQGRDSVHEIFGKPDTAFEFNTTSLTGLTALGSPDAENADNTVPGNYFVRDDAASIALCGRYFSAPSAPFTAIAKLTDANFLGGPFPMAGLFIGVSPPGAMDFVCLDGQPREPRVDRYTNATTFGANVYDSNQVMQTIPFHLAIRVNSSTDVDFLISTTGSVWRELVSARNPSITIGAVGIAMKSEGAAGFSVAFDYLRAWNSALTFPGVV